MTGWSSLTACSLQTLWWSSCWTWVILKGSSNNRCQGWVIFLSHINVLQLPSAVGGACGGDRERSGAEGLWQDGRGHPPHRLLQERGLRTWVCSCRMTCFWDWCVFLLRSLATPVDALNWAVGGLRLHTLHQESSLTPSSPWIYRSIFTPAAHTAAPVKDQNMYRTGRQENEAV